ncbi:unnamed protein product [Soboliphyme baturini]|uniref:Saccharopine dehydrogenase n=1 Tax=Soboliphyme baturini TaxID=241478 RepID=A0A183IG13_9BILA|nr:unnamed protein product [Soboliphyme baturini]
MYGSLFRRLEFPQVRLPFLQILPNCSVLINGIYWEVRAPRLITTEDCKYLLNFKSDAPSLEPHQKLLYISGTIADRGGSVEFTNECTYMTAPFLMYDPETNSYHNPEGILTSSIDNLSAQFPLEATEAFGDVPLPLLKQMVQNKTVICTNPFSNRSISPINNHFRVVLSHDKRHSKILILGAGYVAPPVIECLSRSKDVQLTVATSEVEHVENLSRTLPNIEVQLVDVEEQPDALERLVADHDLVISWLHPLFARMCIRYKRHLLTVSYLSPEMKNLHAEAKAAGITVVSEIGLDPGIDHTGDYQLCQGQWRKGKFCVKATITVNNIIEQCNNYSKSPRNVLLNALSGAKYLGKGNVVETPTSLNIEGFPNRDSTKYFDIYNGFVEVMKAFLSVEKHIMFTPHFGQEKTWVKWHFQSLVYASLKNRTLSFRLELFKTGDLYAYMVTTGDFNKSIDERFEVDLTACGDPKGYSAMARTVGYPVAIAAEMLLEGESTFLIIKNSGLLMHLQYQDLSGDRTMFQLIFYGCSTMPCCRL